ncbi:uncharacterized protein LOC129614992 [Condylostylus longicornis]|uniref:uncharacterized protein LOC129614992 n=1 Tax=Condylostylus longicornis TaxID=2530218 RepID=UPI00244DCB71|nr:uncharacterized protein LOC129614992 [Condylostylus longicornis]
MIKMKLTYLIFAIFCFGQTLIVKSEVNLIDGAKIYNPDAKLSQKDVQAIPAYIGLKLKTALSDAQTKFFASFEEPINDLAEFICELEVSFDIFNTTKTTDVVKDVIKKFKSASIINVCSSKSIIKTITEFANEKICEEPSLLEIASKALDQLDEYIDKLTTYHNGAFNLFYHKQSDEITLLQAITEQQFTNFKGSSNEKQQIANSLSSLRDNVLNFIIQKKAAIKGNSDSTNYYQNSLSLIDNLIQSISGFSTKGAFQDKRFVNDLIKLLSKVKTSLIEISKAADFVHNSLSDTFGQIVFDFGKDLQDCILDKISNSRFTNFIDLTENALGITSSGIPITDDVQTIYNIISKIKYWADEFNEVRSLLCDITDYADKIQNGICSVYKGAKSLYNEGKSKVMNRINKYEHYFNCFLENLKPYDHLKPAYDKFSNSHDGLLSYAKESFSSIVDHSTGFLTDVLKEFNPECAKDINVQTPVNVLLKEIEPCHIHISDKAYSLPNYCDEKNHDTYRGFFGFFGSSKVRFFEDDNLTYVYYHDVIPLTDLHSDLWKGVEKFNECIQDKFKTAGNSFLKILKDCA